MIVFDSLSAPQEHWPIELIRHCRYHKLRFTWCQIFFIRSRLLRIIQSRIKQNESIHYEFLMPTVTYENAFVTKQFENFGYNYSISGNQQKCMRIDIGDI